MCRYFAFVVAIAILLVSGMLYSSLAQDSAQLDMAVSRLAQVPMVIGEWKATETIKDERDDRAFEQAGAKGYWMRVYVNERTDTPLLVILMCGRAGKMAVHTPEVCYHGAGYELTDQPAVFEVKQEGRQGDARFWTGHFWKKAGSTTSLRLFWGWKSGGEWEASSNPRWHFRGEPFLYKLYLSHDVSNRRKIEPNADPAADFLRQLLSELNSSLFSPDRNE